jgi:hypothetical protein
MHVPALHVFVGATQVPPQRPQFAASELRFTSQPFAALPSQFANPGRHAPIAHVPPAHIGAAFGKLQAIPHAPQLFTSLPVGVSHPFAALPSQSEKPGRQTLNVPLPEHR